MLLSMNLAGAGYLQSDMKRTNLFDCAKDISGNGTKYRLPMEMYLRPGEYRLTASGKGKLTLWRPDVPMDKANAIITNGEVYSFNLTLPQVISHLSIVNTDPSNPIHDIKLYPAWLDPADPWNPDYLALLSGFHTLRSGGLYSCNGGPTKEDKEWSDANKDLLGWYLDLCVRVGAHPWFCVPHQASRDYCVNLGKFFADRLPPGFRPRIEPSNEIWNFGPPFGEQSGWFLTQGKAEGLTLRQAYAKIGAVMHSGFAEGFGRPFVRVFAGQFYNPATIIDTLSYAVSNNIGFDAIAAAPYPPDAASLGSFLKMDPTTLTEQDVFNALYDNLNGKTKTLFGTWRAMADQYGVPLMAYEWGPNLMANPNPSWQSLFYKTSRSDGMRLFIQNQYDLMSQYFDEALFTAFIQRAMSTANWGMREYLDDDSPKSQALRACVKRHGV